MECILLGFGVKMSDYEFKKAYLHPKGSKCNCGHKIEDHGSNGRMCMMISCQCRLFTLAFDPARPQETVIQEPPKRVNSSPRSLNNVIGDLLGRTIYEGDLKWQSYIIVHDAKEITWFLGQKGILIIRNNLYARDVQIT